MGFSPKGTCRLLSFPPLAADALAFEFWPADPASAVALHESRYDRSRQNSRGAPKRREGKLIKCYSQVVNHLFTISWQPHHAVETVGIRWDEIRGGGVIAGCGDIASELHPLGRIEVVLELDSVNAVYNGAPGQGHDSAVQREGWTQGTGEGVHSTRGRVGHEVIGVSI